MRALGWKWVAFLVVPLGAAACQGSGDAAGGAGGGPAGGSGGGAAAGGTGAAAGGAGGSGGTISPAACAAAEPFRSPLRRLTRIEYNNTVRDLLGDTSAPADKFPADEVSGGFSNNAAVLSVSPLLAEKYQDAAEALAAAAVRNLAALVGCDTVRTGEDLCARQFIDRFGKRAYRRPLATAEIDRLVKVYAAAKTGATFARGIEVTLRALLQAPSFLYRLENAVPGRAGEKLVRLSAYEVATRISYLLWSTMPDDRLFTAADRNQLGTPAELAAMARLMLDDPRARKGTGEFFRQWLRLGLLDTMVKDATAYPAFTEDVRAGMRAETPAMVEYVLWTGDRKLETLLTNSLGFTTPALARIYGAQVAGAATTPQRIMLPVAERAGVLTQASVLAVHALPDQSSPVHRGKFVREQVLCQDLPPQPPNLMVSAPDVDPTKPTRERFLQHTKDQACAICHQLMDPIGFGFEAYDGIGRFRTTDGGRPVDAKGSLTATRDADGPFSGARELALRLGKSGEVRDCVATQWYRYAFGRLDGPGDACSVASLQKAFAGSGGDIREMLVALTQTDAFMLRPALPSEGAP